MRNPTYWGHLLLANPPRAVLRSRAMAERAVPSSMPGVPCGPTGPKIEDALRSGPQLLAGRPLAPRANPRYRSAARRPGERPDPARKLRRDSSRSPWC